MEEKYKILKRRKTFILDGIFRKIRSKNKKYQKNLTKIHDLVCNFSDKKN